MFDTAEMTLNQFAETCASTLQDIAAGKNICMCGKKLSDAKKLPDTFHVTEKLDGIRCLAICENGGVALVTRNGNALAGYSDIRHAVRQLGVDVVLDGELIAIPAEGETRKQTYERTRADARSGRGQMRLHVFDVLTCTEWRNRRGGIPYIRRRMLLDQISHMLPGNSPLQIVPALYHGQSITRAHELMQEVVAKGGEGVMLNLSNEVYQFGRSGALLKLKPVHVVDLEIIDVLPGTGRNADKTGAIVVAYKGNRVGVSSGLCEDLRKAIFNTPEKYIGRVAAIQYGEESCDAAGNLSLRFPVFVEIREAGKQISYD